MPSAKCPRCGEQAKLNPLKDKEYICWHCGHKFRRK